MAGPGSGARRSPQGWRLEREVGLVAGWIEKLRSQGWNEMLRSATAVTSRCLNSLVSNDPSAGAHLAAVAARDPRRWRHFRAAPLVVNDVGREVAWGSHLQAPGPARGGGPTLAAVRVTADCQRTCCWEWRTYTAVSVAVGCRLTHLAHSPKPSHWRLLRCHCPTRDQCLDCLFTLWFRRRGLPLRKHSAIVVGGPPRPSPSQRQTMTHTSTQHPRRLTCSLPLSTLDHSLNSPPRQSSTLPSPP